ncbi:MAG TPA: VOC family protein [Alphaproteobacteria bacterium]|jgi:catechol-2,3-dioxygenase
MTARSPLWPAHLDLVKVTSPQPDVLFDYYRRILGGAVVDLPNGERLLAGAERRILVGPGDAGKFGYAAYALGDRARLDALRAHVEKQGIAIQPSPLSLLGDGAFAVADPNGNLIAFSVGARIPDAPAADKLPGRLQHVVVTTEDMPGMMAFYADVLGFRLSDRVQDHEGDTTAAFFRSDDEHHSFACFRARGRKLDHFCFETSKWDDIRDWADHLATMHLPIGWGPGRHGPGNNLFFMLNDPDGNAFEFSAEIEHIDHDIATREWPHEQRTLNSWGTAWMRS